jgi:putative ABC transport system permease protein
MFWRIVKQLFRASRGRLVIALMAVISGAAVTTALLNLQMDASKKLSAEFRTLGANVLVLPRANKATSVNANASRDRDSAADVMAASLEDEAIASRVAAAAPGAAATVAPYLFIVAEARAKNSESAAPKSGTATPRTKRAVGSAQVIVAGTWLDETPKMAPWWKISGRAITSRDDLEECLVGSSVAKSLAIESGSAIELNYSGSVKSLSVAGVINSGGDEDSQIFVNLEVAQKLAGLANRVGVVQVSVAGTPEEIGAYMRTLARALPDLDVRPVRQLAEAEGQLLGRLRGLILATVVLILVLTALCVLASMAALAMERRRDVGMMKAIGGSMSRIVTIFLTEAGALGLAGAIVGYALGIELSRWIGRRAFDVSIDARPEVLPLVVALMVGVALAGAFPLRLLGRIRPAEILRGE